MDNVLIGGVSSSQGVNHSISMDTILNIHGHCLNWRGVLISGGESLNIHGHCLNWRGVLISGGESLNIHGHFVLIGGVSSFQGVNHSIFEGCPHFSDTVELTFFGTGRKCFN